MSTADVSEVENLVTEWVTEGWHLAPGESFDFRALLEPFYDWEADAVLLHDNADPDRTVARSAAEYAAIWDAALVDLHALSNTIDDGPHVTVSGDLAVADVCFTTRFEFDGGGVDVAPTRSSLALRRKSGRWYIFREHGSALSVATDEATRPRKGILVIGAGELGDSVLGALAERRRLNDDERSLTVLLRPASTRRRDHLSDKGIALVEADVATASVSDLARIMSRYHTVVSCLGFAAGAGTQRKLAEAALQAGVSRFVPWQFGVDYDVIGRGSPQELFDEQLDVRDLLRGQKQTEWIIVSTGMFTSFLFDPGFGVVDLDGRTVHALGDWDNEVTVTTAEDIGALTAEVVHLEPHIVNQVVYLAGDTLTYRRLADVVEQVSGVPITRTAWSLPHLLDELASEPTDTMRKYRAVFAMGKGVAWPKERTFNAFHGIPTTDAAQWAHGNLPGL